MKKIGILVETFKDMVLRIVFPVNPKTYLEETKSFQKTRLLISLNSGGVYIHSCHLNYVEKILHTYPSVGEWALKRSSLLYGPLKSVSICCK
eukprot:snap_masked-scaffold_26-processed-gene-0.35-mRNA-1 protein AED:1.00 eAED:1.00 QI:0/0/0/0/1/1/2/0/91